MEDEILTAIIGTLEAKAGKKVHTIHVSDDERPVEDMLEALVIFTDGSKLDSRITVQKLNSGLAIRIRGNYI